MISDGVFVTPEIIFSGRFLFQLKIADLAEILGKTLGFEMRLTLVSGMSKAGFGNDKDIDHVPQGFQTKFQ
jgi:hypothetical protein